MKTSKPLVYIPEIENAYSLYAGSLPLDLIGQDVHSHARSSWKANNQYNILEFSRQVYLLCSASNIDSYIKSSASDFDNLAPVIAAAVEAGLVSVDSRGNVKKRLEFLENLSLEVSTAPKQTFVPDASLNQFPCDATSTQKRLKLIREHFPYVENLTFGIIGEDDFLSIEALQSPELSPVVIEKDKRITEAIRQEYKKKDRNPVIYELDIAESGNNGSLPRVQTFITDPPYTLDGALSFICLGLSMLDFSISKRTEFFVILNPTMMGEKLYSIIRVLSSAGIYLTGTKDNYSQYLLPANFSERKRADAFLNEQGINKQAITYSSSSNLYVFTVDSDFDLAKVQENVNLERMYEHY